MILEWIVQGNPERLPCVAAFSLGRKGHGLKCQGAKLQADKRGCCASLEAGRALKSRTYVISLMTSGQRLPVTPSGAPGGAG